MKMRISKLAEEKKIKEIFIIEGVAYDIIEKFSCSLNQKNIQK